MVSLLIKYYLCFGAFHRLVNQHNCFICWHNIKLSSWHWFVNKVSMVTEIVLTYPQRGFIQPDGGSIWRQRVLILKIYLKEETPLKRRISPDIFMVCSLNGWSKLINFNRECWCVDVSYLQNWRIQKDQKLAPLSKPKWHVTLQNIICLFHLHTKVIEIASWTSLYADN